MGKLKDKKKSNIIDVVDCHTHIIPKVDDGSRNLEESVQLVDMLVKQGITTIFATPHLVIDTTVMDKQKTISDQLDKLRKETNDKTVNLVLGYEVMGSERLIDVDDYSKFTMGASNIIMVEANPMSSLSWMEELIYELKLQSIQLLIAHAERYLYFKEYPQMLENFKDQGAFVQINTGSIGGNNGKKQMRWTRNLIKENLVDVIGSDCHQLNWRKPEINQYLMSLNKWCDKKQFNNITYNNAKKILF